MTTPESIEVLSPGLQTTVQDYPGRLGYWDVGVPPSGPMDPLAFQIANRILGNRSDAAALEITLHGPRFFFHAAAEIAITGARSGARLNGKPIPFWRTLVIRPGDVLDVGAIRNRGCRAYLAVKGGFEVATYLESKSTFILGGFGGHEGRSLRTGDCLTVANASCRGESVEFLPSGLIPQYPSHWRIGVMSGPHGAPDFFTRDDIEVFFSANWQVHHNSDRTGVRLIGPNPQWARPDGGEAGLHPSNIHDNAYAVGAIDFTGDMPVILGPDGPSLGGFVCPATIPQAEFWKTGQLRPGDRIRFFPLNREEAQRRWRQQEECISSLAGDIEEDLPHRLPKTTVPIPGDAVIRRSRGRKNAQVVFRQSGDNYLLVEFGPNVLDLNLRFKVHVVHQWIRNQNEPGLIDITPGIRSLQIHFDSRRIAIGAVIDLVTRAVRDLPRIDGIELPTRIVHLPLSWDDPSTREAIRRYQQTVRPDAPWCPSNIEFIRRINGLESIDEVKATVFDASYLVLGLGDVYLGAPVATPLDPRHRLVTTKYNPARTWTPENAVGIGGAYLCIYGMEGPGGYQFVGRTLQMWNRFRATDCFEKGKPWLLRFFDEIRFYPVSAGELLELRENFLEGRFTPKIESHTFRLGQYNQFLKDHADSIKAFKRKQQQAFEEERSRWKAAERLPVESDAAADAPAPA